MEWVRYGCLMSSVMGLRHDLLTVLLIHWDYITAITLKMLELVAPLALKELSDFKEAMPQAGVWRSVIIMSGAQCVMTSGALKRLRLYAGSWDMNQQVRFDHYAMVLTRKWVLA
jgi:hypothetical protein